MRFLLRFLPQFQVRFLRSVRHRIVILQQVVSVADFTERDRPELLDEDHRLHRLPGLDEQRFDGGRRVVGVPLGKCSGIEAGEVGLHRLMGWPDDVLPGQLAQLGCLGGRHARIPVEQR